MSIWDEEWENYEDDKNDFEAWLDSLEGEGTDEEKYNREMDKQADAEYEMMNQAVWPEWMVKGKDYIMTVSNN
mgnify:FL=1|jgi:hypothetical protein